MTEISRQDGRSDEGLVGGGFEEIIGGWGHDDELLDGVVV